MFSDSQTRRVPTSDHMLRSLRTNNLMRDMATNGLLFCIHAFFLKERRECLELGAPLGFGLFVTLRDAFGTFLVVNALAFIRDAVVLCVVSARVYANGYLPDEPMEPHDRGLVTFLNTQIKSLYVYGGVLFVIAIAGAVGEMTTYLNACNPDGKQGQIGMAHYIPAVMAAYLAPILCFIAVNMWEE